MKAADARRAVPPCAAGAAAAFGARVTAATTSEWWPLLSAQDRVHAGGIRVDAARSAFVHARGLARAVLGRLLDLDPRDVPISRACGYCGDPAHGKPFVDADGAPCWSAARCRSLALVVVAGDEVGVDVEGCDHPFPWQDLREEVFGAAERAWLGGLSEGERDALAWRSWTAKEAVVKWLGTGLRTPLDAVEVEADTARVGPHGLALHDLAVGADCVATLAARAPLSVGPVIWMAPDELERG